MAACRPQIVDNVAMHTEAGSPGNLVKLGTPCPDPSRDEPITGGDHIEPWGGYELHVFEPPRDNSAKAEEWWEQQWVQNWLERDLPFLALLVEASERHRRNGSTATYCNRSDNRTMVAWYFSETRLPVPLPERVEERARRRLDSAKQEELRPNALHGLWATTPRNVVGCSESQATDFWRQAMLKYGWGPNKVEPLPIPED
jgi:hypothetical protein